LDIPWEQGGIYRGLQPYADEANGSGMSDEKRGQHISGRQ
jgi:hypothetical protein